MQLKMLGLRIKKVEIIFWLFIELIIIATSTDGKRRSTHAPTVPVTTKLPVTTGLTHKTTTNAPSNNTSTVKSVSPTNYSGVIPNRADIRGIGLRAFYVISAISLIVVLYFIVRAVCSRRRRNKTRRYGMLRQEGGDMELRPLSEGEDDEEEDLTLFDATQRKSGSRR